MKDSAKRSTENDSKVGLGTDSTLLVGWLN